MITFFCVVLLITGVRAVAVGSDGKSSQDGSVSSQRTSQCFHQFRIARHVNMQKTTPKHDERSPLHKRLAVEPPSHLPPRDPHLLGDLLGANGGKKGAKAVKTNIVTQLVTVTKTMPNNATVPPATVFVTMPAETITNMMMMTVLAPAAAPAAAAAEAPNAAPAPAAAAAAAPGMASVLTLGNLLPQPSLAPPAPPAEQIAEAVVGSDTVPPPTSAPTTTPTGTVFGVATETSTLVVTADEVVATETGTATSMKSEAISGRQAGTRCVGFGAVVVAIGVAVLIL